MSSKVNPKAYRLGTGLEWTSKWYARKRRYAHLLLDDLRMRAYIKKQLKEAHVSDIIIERFADNITININLAKPGVVIGRGGAGVETLQKNLAKMIKCKKETIKINIIEIKKPNLNADIVAFTIAQDLEKRMPFRRSMKQTIERVMRSGAKGIKVKISGRLNGADIARTETLVDGSIPLTTLRAFIDYSHAEALTTFGIIGIKVWIYKGEFSDPENQPHAALKETH